MKFSQRANISRIGVQLTGLMFEKHGYIFREQPVSDCGIDAHIERIKEDSLASGELIALQIKSGKSWFRERNETGFVYRGNIAHLEYWLGHSLPVLIVLCDIQKGIVYWQSICQKTVEYTSKGWKITIPFSQQVDQETKQHLFRFIKNTSVQDGQNETVMQAVCTSVATPKNQSEEKSSEEVRPNILRKKQWTAAFKRYCFYIYSAFCLFTLFRDSLGHDGYFAFHSLVRSLQSPGEEGSLFVVLGLWCFWFIRYSLRFRHLAISLVLKYVTKYKEKITLRPRLIVELNYLAKRFFFYLYCIFCLMLLLSSSLDSHRNFSFIQIKSVFSQPGSMLTILTLVMIGLLLFFRGYLPGKRKRYSQGVTELLFLIKGSCFYLYTIYCLFLLLGASLDADDHVSIFQLMNEFFISDGGSILLLHTGIWLSWCFYRTIEPGVQYYSGRIRTLVFRLKRGMFYFYSGTSLIIGIKLVMNTEIPEYGLTMSELFCQDSTIQCICLMIVWLLLLVRWYLPALILSV
ncbi:DUF4365 domain-containing protein [Vibrio aerogenes]|uniref:DUF4365 domain-containing protein n=1 Tax=Vibrio aerogenes TaxID=92172 RepID=UPI0039EDFE40